MATGLVEHADAVSKTTFAVSSKKRQGAVFYDNLFLFSDLSKVGNNLLLGNRSESVALSSADDCLRQLMGVGGSEDKYNVGRRFFQSFQKCIKSFFGKHVDFVNDVDLVLSTGWGDGDFITELADFVDPTVAGSIYLYNIHVHTIIFVRDVVYFMG